VRRNPAHEIDDPRIVAELIRAHPWATLVSEGEDGIVASHYPVLLDEEAEGLTLLTHLGRPDEEVHRLDRGEMLVIVQGRHGYISPSWYAPGATRAPTWNFTVAHCYGVPEVLAEEENVAVLGRLVERFEREVEEPLYLDREWARPVSRGTVGLRIPVGRFVCKRKLSQDKDPVSRRQVIEKLREPGPYHHPGLAEEMERELGEEPSREGRAARPS
jgi:transcriptional regulator